MIVRILLLLAFVVSAAASGQIGKGANFYTVEKEIAIGQGLSIGHVPGGVGNESRRFRAPSSNR